ncbi:DNA glycosylase [Dactylonectria estremocensis]|uniref:DNA glycosylase n=1 Tax=Dactylonectria estremocensis TaxID=1079267 RepID=A0A9P9JF00_9HYPO|nr:DNA glycosylase [Dactylonectria estremocensis]
MIRSLRKRPVGIIATRPPAKRRQTKVNRQADGDGQDDLPHNLGSIRAPKPRISALTPDLEAVKTEEDSAIDFKAENAVVELKQELSTQEDAGAQSSYTASRRSLRPRRSIAPFSYRESDDESIVQKAPAQSTVDEPGPNKRTLKKEAEEEDAKLVVDEKPRKTPGKSKDNPYGLTPGITPFPEWTAPSIANCKEIYNQLAKLHGKAKAPDKIPAPSLEVSGCGEVPSVLDAMIRTRLSAHTSAANSNAAFKGLVTRFGVIKDGIGEGSVNWDNVRTAPVEDIVKSIKHGGLAQTKGRDIKAILGIVHQENMARRDAFVEEKKTGKKAEVIGASDKTQGQKDLEILKADQGLLSLDHIHGMHPDEAMQALIKFPGIGVKTASCVILFCLQQPSFAVDTHVHRLAGWLKWMPPKATRDQTFSHLEVRIPNDLKYGLHKLFVQHGRSCVRCRANTTEGTEEWKRVDCPIEMFVDRTGKKMGGKPGTSKRKKMEED